MALDNWSKASMTYLAAVCGDDLEGALEVRGAVAAGARLDLAREIELEDGTAADRIPGLLGAAPGAGHGARYALGLASGMLHR